MPIGGFWRTACAVLACALTLGSGALAQTPSDTFPVYVGRAPGTEGWRQRENSLDLMDTRFNPANPDTLIWNVTRPTLTVFRPAPGTANGTAIVVAPGGGFRVLSYANEGVRVGQWLAAHGVTAFVLKYRLHAMTDDPAVLRRTLDQMMAAAAAPPGAPGGPPPLPPLTIGDVERGAISDGQHAVALVRQRAGEFAINPNRIGIMGFSAGGTVASGTAVLGAGAERPDFVGIIYSFYPDAVASTAPPAFMAAAADDPLAERLPDLFTRWRAAGVPAELHIYAKGRHGFGTAHQNLPVDGWLDVFYAWMGQQGFLSP